MLVIRLTTTGRKGERRFKIVVSEKRSRRDGKPVETLGWYEKRVSRKNHEVSKERYDYWISQGAQPSPTVKKIVAS